MREALHALEKWCKIEAVVIRPLRGGKKKRNRGAISKWQKNMERWIDGGWETVWKETCELETRRKISRWRRKNKQVHKAPEEVLMKKWHRIKMLVNDGELSKAAREIDGAGVAEPNEKVISELKTKYPRRKEDIEWPNIEDIMKELESATLADNTTKVNELLVPDEMAVDDEMGYEQRKPQLQTHETVAERAKRWQDESKTRTSVTSEDIQKAVRRIKKSTGGGP